MPRRHLTLPAAAQAEVHEALARLRAELDVPAEFPADVLAGADAAVAEPRLPEFDRTDLAFATIDPIGSRDLDQAFHLERAGDGYIVRYAIADVAAFVRPGGAIDAEAHVRGETRYAPDGNTLLHPPVIAHAAGSLLPDQTRPALLWTIELDATGEGTAVDVRRALVRSREQLDYASAQAEVDAGAADERLVLLREIGELRRAREAERDGVSLPIPEQVVVARDGGYALELRAPTPVEEWNAQLSLLTGMAAAELMLYAGVGVVRTLPPPSPSQVARLRRSADGLGIGWRDGMSHDAFIRSLDATVPAQAALLTEAATLLRGAGYSAFDGGLPELATHAGVGGEYAHATAPLRRLVDRYVGEVCVALCADEPVPDWARTELPNLPRLMAASNQRAQAYESGIVSTVEAVVLQHSVGHVFRAVVVDVDDDGARGTIQIEDPPVLARCEGSLSLGAQVVVRLVEADVPRRTVRFVRDE